MEMYLILFANVDIMKLTEEGTTETKSSPAGSSMQRSELLLKDLTGTPSLSFFP